MKKLHNCLLGILLAVPSITSYATEQADNSTQQISWFTKVKQFVGFSSPTDTLRFPVTIICNQSSITDMLQEQLPLIAQQIKQDIDYEQASFLAEDAPEQINTLLKTQGYFNSTIQVAPENHGWKITIDTGPRTHISAVNVAILGDVLGDDNLSQYYKDALENWELATNEPFTQSEWNSSKDSVLFALTRNKYPLAQITHSEAKINPETHQATLSVVVDSHQPIYFGQISVDGSNRYPVNIVTGLAPFTENSPYQLSQLLNYQQSLEQNSHYVGASVRADFDQLNQDKVPVLVHVDEIKRHKLDTSLRYNTAEGPGGRINYDYYNLFNHGYVGSVLVDIDRFDTTASLGIKQPKQLNGNYWSNQIAFSRSTTQKLEKQSLNMGLWLNHEQNNTSLRLGIEYINEQNHITNGPNLGNRHALMLTATWQKQNIQTILRPVNGYFLEAKASTTLSNLASSVAFQRIYARGLYYYTPEEKKYGTVVARGRIGYVHTNNTDAVPTGILFRSGGASSIRGYTQDSIGITGPNGSILPGKFSIVGSLEYQLPITKNISLAIFEDLGTVSDSLTNLPLKNGTGVGIRWFSAFAPFSFDIAYGHADKKIQWHINLGTRF